MIRDPDGNKMRGIRMPNELWEAVCEVAVLRHRSATKEVIVALKEHLRRNGYEVIDD